MTAFLPALLMVAAALAMPPFRFERRARSALFAAAFTLVLLRYLWWRLTQTVLPGGEGFLGQTVLWGIFAIEFVAWLELLLLLAILLRQTDRSREADHSEARLRRLPPGSLPAVDVFIATYDEPVDVLERTIAGALALDWPAARLSVCVLDDGRRGWLKSYCEARGVVYMTRSDNAHAKAGNINAAAAARTAPFFLILDADFVPRRNFLMRVMGFFDDPRVGIVQTPHHFFNPDQMQTNLDLRSELPDEQRFFFNAIQPGRDGWNAAICCGSNGIIRRAALDSVGGRMPTDSITEDMLLTMTLLRKGFVTRYLNEPLAIGLAPENIDAYFLQRARWAQGAIQTLYLRSGPFGPGLTPMQRLLFLPTHWLTQSLAQLVSIAVPAFFLLTGIPPMIVTDVSDIFAYQLPTVFCAGLVIGHFAPRYYVPLSSLAQSLMQAVRLTPIILKTMVKPRGHRFRVTPKGSDAGAPAADAFTLRACFTLVAATGAGLLINANPQTRLIEVGALLPVVAFWAVVNMILLLTAAAVAVPGRALRAQERFAAILPCRLHAEGGVRTGETADLSLSGGRIRIDMLPPDGAAQPGLSAGDWLGVELPEVGIVPARLRRVLKAGPDAVIGVDFSLPSGAQRDGLIQLLYTEGHATIDDSRHRARGTVKMLLVALGLRIPRTAGGRPPAAAPLAADAAEPPDWLAGKVAACGPRGASAGQPGSDRLLPAAGGGAKA